MTSEPRGQMRRRRPAMGALLGGAASLCLAAVLVPAVAAAQTRTTTTRPAAKSQPAGPANALQGFSQNRDEPVRINAATLEVRDKDKVATFSGDVQVVQGDTTLRCASLVVYYEDDAAKGGMPSATPGPNGQQRIRLLEAKGGVTVIQKDQTATASTGMFNMRENTVTLSGNVVMQKGEDVLRGERLVVDLTTGVSRVEAGRGGTGRVDAVFSTSGGMPGATPGQPGRRN